MGVDAETGEMNLLLLVPVLWTSIGAALRWIVRVNILAGRKPGATVLKTVQGHQTGRTRIADPWWSLMKMRTSAVESIWWTKLGQPWAGRCISTEKKSCSYFGFV